MRHVHLPRSLNDVWELLQGERDAALYAGGTDLLVKIRSGQVDPGALVCLERVGELHGVRDEGEAIFLGAATTHVKILEHGLIREELPVLARALGVLGSPPIRHMGTIGGNVVTASPAGDSLPPLYVLGAEVEIRSSGSVRRTAIRDFVMGPGKVDLCRGELVVGLRVPKPRKYNVQHFEKVGRRKAQACAVASLAALLDLSVDGRINQARLAWGSVGSTVVRSEELENALAGKLLNRETLERLRPLVESAVSPIDDVRASADYRRVVAGALMMRLVEYAAPERQRPVTK
jgi:CO/xanthine dehydrogenase FAD-binding subunit